MTLLYLVAAWIAGMLLIPAHHSPAGWWIAVAAGSLLLARVARDHRTVRLTGICAIFFALGAARYTWAAQPLSQDDIGQYADSGYVTLTGVIVQDPDIRDTHTNLRVNVDSITQRGEIHRAEGVALLQAPRYGDHAYGDRIRASGFLLTPPEFDDFSYRDYLARRGIHVMMSNAEVTLLSRDQGKPWYAALYALKKRAQSTIDRMLPSPQAPLLSGILLGAESAIPENVRQAFDRTGTSHIIAISGANIVVVISVLMRLLEPPLGRKRAAWITVVGIGGYTIFVGADPSVVRAAITGSLALTAAQSGRKAHGLTLLAFAVWLMSLWNPFVLWDIGFQLSVAATTGLILFGSNFTQALESLLKRGFAQETARQVTRILSEPVALGLAAQITTTPLILLYFQRFSLVSLLANILIGPVQPYIMTVGWISVLLGMAWPLLGEPLAWVTWMPLTYTLKIVRALGAFKWASVDMDLGIPTAWSIYAALALLGFVVIQHPDDRRALFEQLRHRISTLVVITAGTIIAILVWATAVTQPDGKLHVWFLDVGHGQAVLIRTPQGAHILIDGGPSPNRLRQTIGDVMPFWNHRLDLMIVTQPTTAAITALPALLARYEVRQALTNGETSSSEPYIALTNAWQTHKIPVQTITAGSSLETNDHVVLEILNPQSPPNSETKTEAAGMVIRLRYGDASFLIMPKLDGQAEKTILEAGWYLGSNVLILPSQGDADANQDFFLQAVHPLVAVAMVGAGNRSGLPDEVIVERLRQINNTILYRTDRNGTVEIVTDGTTLWTYTEN